HSIDNGRTWDSLPIGLGRSHDHPTMAVDLSAGPHRGWIYLSSHLWAEGRRYGVYIARSRNGGKSFDDPVYVIPNNLHNLAEMPVVLTDGTLFESFVDATYTPDSGGTQAREVLFDRRRAWVTRSSDGGFTIAARTSMRPYPRTAVPRFPAEFSLRPVLAVEITSASQPFRAVAFAFFGQKRAMAYNSSARRLWTLHPERQLTSAGSSRRASLLQY